MAWCCGTTGATQPKMLEPDVEATLKATRFTLAEIQEIYRRFMDATKGKPYMQKFQFREVLGFVDNQSSMQIVDRIYESLAEPDKGISFTPFAQYLEKLVGSNISIKTQLCFSIIDHKKKGAFSESDLSTLILSIIGTNPINGVESIETQHKVNQVAKFLFARFDIRKTGTVDFEEFSEVVREDPSLLEIFTLLNKGIYEHFVKQSLEEERRHWFMNQTKYISITLNECQEVLKHARTQRMQVETQRLERNRPADPESVPNSTMRPGSLNAHINSRPFGRSVDNLAKISDLENEQISNLESPTMRSNLRGEFLPRIDSLISPVRNTITNKLNKQLQQNRDNMPMHLHTQSAGAIHQPHPNSAGLPDAGGTSTAPTSTQKPAPAARHYPLPAEHTPHKGAPGPTAMQQLEMLHSHGHLILGVGSSLSALSPQQQPQPADKHGPTHNSAENTTGAAGKKGTVAPLGVVGEEEGEEDGDGPPLDARSLGVRSRKDVLVRVHSADGVFEDEEEGLMKPQSVIGDVVPQDVPPPTDPMNPFSVNIYSVCSELEERESRMVSELGRAREDRSDWGNPGSGGPNTFIKAGSSQPEITPHKFKKIGDRQDIFVSSDLLKKVGDLVDYCETIYGKLMKEKEKQK